MEAWFKQFPELRGKRIVLFLGRINFKKGLDILRQPSRDCAESEMTSIC